MIEPKIPDQQPVRSPRLTADRIHSLFAQLDAAIEPGEGHEPAQLLAETNRQDVFRELIWRMHNHPSPEVRYWCCYELCWEQPASAEFVEVLERPGEHPRIRGQACEGLGYVLEFARPTLAWYRRAETALLKALYDPAVAVRWWACFALGLAKSRRAIPKLRELADNDHAMMPGWWPVAQEAEDALLNIEREPGPERALTGQQEWSWDQ